MTSKTATRHAWKQAERRVAEIFGGRRRTGSGCDYRTGEDDVIHDKLFIEVKYRQSHGPVNWWKKVKEGAARAKKVPVLALVAKRDKDIYLLVPLDGRYLDYVKGFVWGGHPDDRPGV